MFDKFSKFISELEQYKLDNKVLNERITENNKTILMLKNEINNYKSEVNEIQPILDKLISNNSNINNKEYDTIIKNLNNKINEYKSKNDELDNTMRN